MTGPVNDFDPVVIGYEILQADTDRLERELPMLHRWVDGAQSLLDLACGTAVHAHAIARARPQMHVTATDLSPAMIAHAQTHRRAENLTCRVGDMQQPPDQHFDRIMILGNALPLLADAQAVADTLGTLHDRLADGGSLLIQVVNPNARTDTTPRTVSRYKQTDRGTVHVIKTLWPREQVDLLSVAVFCDTPHWHSNASTAVIQQLSHSRLTGILKTAGFSRWQCFGNLEGHPFDETRSSNLVVMAER